MTTSVQRRRGSTVQHSSFTGLEGEITVDTNKDTAVVHDGSTIGGFPLAKEGLENTHTANLPAIIGTDTASDDTFLIYDASASAMKKITRAELNNAIEVDALSNVTITGGSINGTTIGSTTASSGAFTTLSASSTVTFSGLNASQAVFTNGSKQLVSNAITGTGNVVMSASPTLTGTLTAAAITASGNIIGNGSWTLGNADTDTITVGASFVTGSVLRSAKVATNTLALAAYDVDGAAYTNLITLTASNTPTLALTSTGVGTINNMSIGATTASTGKFTTLESSSTTALNGTTIPASKTLLVTTDIGTSVQGYDAQLADVAGLTPTDNGVIIGNGTNFVIESGATLRTSLGLSIGADVQAYDADLTTLGAGGSSARTFLGLGTGDSPTFTTQSLSGNLTFTGTGNRITGDFSNATHSNRVLFQSSTVNGNTIVGFIPNGTATQSQLNVYANSDSTNSTQLQLRSNTTACVVSSSANGTGTFVPLALDTGGSERMRIDTSGNVGIGTTTPAAKLDVAGSQYIRGSAAAGAVLVLTSDATSGVNGCNIAASFLTGGYGPITFTTSTVERMRITSSGNVGIQSTSPTATLELGTVVTGSPTCRIGDFTSQAPNSSVTSIEVLGARIDGNTTFGGRHGAAFRRTDGTAIASGTGLGYYAFGGQWGTDTSYQSAKLLYTASIVAVSEGSFTSASAMPTAIVFSTGSTGQSLSSVNVSYGTERMRIDSIGRIAMGSTATANARLFVVGADSTSSNWSILTQNSSSITQLGIRNDNFLLAPCIGNYATTGTQLVLAGGNYIGFLSSSIRFKKDVVDYDKGLVEVNQLRPVYYRSSQPNQDGEYDERTYAGFIAEEVKELGLEEYIDYNNEGEVASLKYGQMTAILCKAIQEQQAMIEELKAKVAALEAK